MRKIFFNRLVTAKDDDEHANATSSEILADVLEQLEKLGTEKRNIVLNKLKAANLIANTDDIQTNEKKQSSASPKSAVKPHEQQASDADQIQDEVEILDMDEPKMGIYKRKRSKYPDQLGNRSFVHSE